MNQQRHSLSVLHLTFNMGFGGTEQVIRQLILGMTDQNVRSEVLCIDGHVGAIGEQLQKLDIPVASLKRSPGFDRELIRGVRQKIVNGEFDIIHCHQYTPYIYGFLAALGTRAKVVFTEHGRFHPDRYRYKAMLINPVMALVTPAIIAISKATRMALARYEFIPAFKIKVIYNGIQHIESDPKNIADIRAKLGLPDNAFVTGTVSRLDPVKNQVMMLKAFKLFLQEQSDAWLLMVGDGPDREMLQRLAIDLAIGGRVIFTGFIHQPIDYLAAMDVFLLSSHTEGTSMTLLEAMCLGIPSVVTHVGGNPEIVVDGETGFLCPANDESAFAAAMKKLSADAELIRKFAENSRSRFIKRFSAQKMAENYLSLYKHLVKHHYSDN